MRPVPAIDTLHSNVVYDRRVQTLAKHLSQFISRDASVLDVGTGDGLLASSVRTYRPDLTITGVDVLERPKTYIPVKRFDGVTLPFADNEFDTVTFVDVLHHTEDPLIMLREAARVARSAIVLKDHLREGPLANTTLRFMDWVGNRRYGVALPYNYWSRLQWRQAFRALGLQEDRWLETLHLYPWPLDVFFGRSLHFIACLSVAGSDERTFADSRVAKEAS